MPYTICRPLKDAERKNLANFSDLTAHLLFHRGYKNAESAEKFLRPDYDTEINDPFLLKDAKKAAERVIQAIKNNERVAIYADYDADGIPGAAIFNDFFKRVGFKNYTIYIPHRHNEGFGLNEEAVIHLANDEKAKLIITIDCGITDVLPADKAYELGVDLIITDHHEPPPILPKAFAIIDHKQADCLYPDKNICGSGVAFKLIQAILKTDRLGLGEGQEKWLLDLLGIATLSDMVSLTGENRVFAHYGLAVLRKSPRKGLMQLLRKLKIDQRYLNEDDVAFMITPRINAASRMGLPMDAFSLLAADNDVDAHFFADHLDTINNERKGIVASLVKEVKKIVRERHEGNIPKVIVLGNPLWRPSLLGLAANSCAEEFKRPVFLWGRDGDNSIKGSCRSEGKTSVVELMRNVPVGIFSQFGGHHHSGGFAVSNEQIHYLELKLNEVAGIIASTALELEKVKDGAPNSSNSPGDTADADISNAETVDAELSLDAVDDNLSREINKLSPFGVGNPKPIFLFKKVTPMTSRTFGKANDHVELTFQKSNGQKLSAICFFGAGLEWVKRTLDKKPIDLIASVEKSMYRGRAELRLRIEDVVL